MDRYCKYYQVGNRYNRRQITGTNLTHISEVKTALEKFFLRRKKNEVLKDLPPIFYSTTYVRSDLQPPDYLVEKLKDELEVLMEAINFHVVPSEEKLLSSLMAMSQSVSSLRRYHGFKKIQPTIDLVTTELELQLYEKIVIFGIHKDVLSSLKAELSRKYDCVSITGADSNPKHRQEAIDRFQNDPKCQIFLGNINAAGTAITLTAANQVLFIEQSWVPGDNAQAAMRCHRIGQTKTVTCRFVSLDDALDTKITTALARKTQELGTFIG